MAKALYIGIGGKARKVKKMYIGIGGKARKVKKSYIGINGYARSNYISNLYISPISSTIYIYNSVLCDGYSNVLFLEQETGSVNDGQKNSYVYGINSTGIKTSADAGIRIGWFTLPVYTNTYSCYIGGKYETFSSSGKGYEYQQYDLLIFNSSLVKLSNSARVNYSYDYRYGTGVGENGITVGCGRASASTTGSEQNILEHFTSNFVKTDNINIGARYIGMVSTYFHIYQIFGYGYTKSASTTTANYNIFAFNSSMVKTTAICGYVSHCKYCWANSKYSVWENPSSYNSDLSTSAAFNTSLVASSVKTPIYRKGTSNATINDIHYYGTPNDDQNTFIMNTDLVLSSVFIPDIKFTFSTNTISDLYQLSKGAFIRSSNHWIGHVDNWYYKVHSY